jgi:tetratricopeptide (TPR) repeat protein
MGDHYERGRLLYSQSRFDLAEKELRQALLDDPNDGFAHGLFAMCLSERKEHQAATEEAKLALEAAADSAFTHFAMARVLYNRDRLDEAARAIEEAIRIDHERPAYFATLGAIRFDQGKWQEALEASERGLEIDPGHTGCANLRSMALLNLGRKTEAGSAIEGVLERDPNNAMAHSTRGWALLEGGDRLKALEHFKEALRIDPELEPARTGIAEALKARNIVYAVLLRYFLRMSRLHAGVQWGLIVAGLAGVRALGKVAEAQEALAPWIWPVLIVYFIFVILSWIGDPLFNLLLRFDPLGRHALSPEQLAASSWAGGTLLVATGASIVGLILRKPEALLASTGIGLLALPIVGLFRCSRGRARIAMALLTTLLALAGLTALGMYLVTSPEDPDAISAARGLAATCISGALASTWVVSALGLARRKK